MSPNNGFWPYPADLDVQEVGSAQIGRPIELRCVCDDSCCGERGKRAYLMERSVFGLPESPTQRYRWRIYSMIYLPAGFGSRARGCWPGGEIGPAAGARRAAQARRPFFLFQSAVRADDFIE